MELRRYGECATGAASYRLFTSFLQVAVDEVASEKSVSSQQTTKMLLRLVTKFRILCKNRILRVIVSTSPGGAGLLEKIIDGQYLKGGEHLQELEGAFSREVRWPGGSAVNVLSYHTTKHGYRRRSDYIRARTHKY